MSVPIVAALVAAAISLKAPLVEASRRFAAASPGEAITFTFGASGQLAAQIERGAPADLFVSASPVEMERLLAAKRIDPATRTAIAGNRLVVIVPHRGPKATSLADLKKPEFARITVANPKTVPAGRYAKEALDAGGISNAIESRLLFAENVRQVVDLVVRAEADAGLVYATDVALGGRAIALAVEVPQNLHTPIVYEAGVVIDAAAAARARAFLGYLKSPAGRAILAGSGFAAPPP
jgi:molybdate transport system substrate-binding protein